MVIPFVSLETPLSHHKRCIVMNHQIASQWRHIIFPGDQHLDTTVMLAWALASYCCHLRIRHRTTINMVYNGVFKWRSHESNKNKAALPSSHTATCHIGKVTMTSHLSDLWRSLESNNEKKERCHISVCCSDCDFSNYLWCKEDVTKELCNFNLFWSFLTFAIFRLSNLLCFFPFQKISICNVPISFSFGNALLLFLFSMYSNSERSIWTKSF